MSPSVVLFLALFASQAGVLVMSPILGDVAEEFDVSVAAAGQLRILAAPLAAVVALVTVRLLGRFSPRALLAAGSAFLAVGSLASAAAPSFVLLGVAQAPLWVGVALLGAAGIAATAAWSTTEGRPKLVARAFAGPPAAWIVGMPIAGLVAEIDWRLTFIAVPFPAALLLGLSIARMPGDSPIGGMRTSLAGLMRARAVRRWTAAELLANAAWVGTSVFSGALLTEVHGLSPTVTGLVLALVAAVYLAGNHWAGGGEPSRARRTLVEATLAASVAVALTWALAPSPTVTVVLYAVAAFAAATRTVAGTVHGFAVAGDLGREVGAVRAATSHVGYLVGTTVGGAMIALGGFEALALAFGGFLLLSALPLLCLRGTCPSGVAPQPAA